MMLVALFSLLLQVWTFPKSFETNMKESLVKRVLHFQDLSAVVSFRYLRNRRSLLLIAINNFSLSHYRFHLDIGTRGRRKSENRISFICVIKRKAKKALEWSLWTWLKALSLGFTCVECLWWNVINFDGLFCTEAIYMKPSNLRGHKALSMQNTKSRFNPSESIVELMNMMCPLTSRNVIPSPTKCN